MSKALKYIIIATTAAISVGGFFAYTSAAFNEQINYQGKLTDATGVAIADGTYCMKFAIYTVATEGSPIWSETWTVADSKVTLTSGLFSILLGSHSSLSSVNFNQSALYLEVQLDVACDGAYEEVFAPRKQMGSVPASFEAKQLGGYTWASPAAIGTGTASTGVFTNLTDSGLTATRVTYAGTAGLLSDSADFTYAAGTLTLGAASTSTGKLSLNGTTSGTVDITTAAAAGIWTLTLPADDGTSGQVLSTNGSGVTSWVAQSAAMTYPGAGIAVSTGSAWGTSITDSSANWNAAYSAMHTQGTDSAVNSSLSGVLFATTGTLSTKAIGTDIQAYDAELAGLAALSYSSGTPFIKMTAAGTFSLDTSTYLTANQSISLSGAVTGSGTTSISTTLAENIVAAANMKGTGSAKLADGSAGNLLKSLGDGTFGWDTSTYLTSLSGALLATGATTGATSQAQIFTNGVTLSNLTATRVTYAGTAGLLSDSADFTYAAGNLTLGAAATSTGKLSFKGTTSGTIDITTAAAAGTWTMTLPTTDGDSGQVLTTNGSGVLSWSAASAGMVYPAAGIAVSTGSAWGTSLTDNSSNWNAAYSAMHTQGTDSAVNSSLSGVLFATAGTLSTKAIGTDIQAYDAELAGLAGLSYSSGTPFVKMTAAGTFSLDTSTYLTSLSGALLADGSVTGATSSAQTFTNGVKLSNLTSGRVPYTTTAGALTDSANFTYSSTGMLSISQTIANTNAYALSVSETPSYSGALSRVNVGIYANVYPNAVTSAVNSLGTKGLQLNVLRNQTSSQTDDNGEIAYLYGGTISYGHGNENVVSPVTTEAVGLSIGPSIETGTIGTMYDLKLSTATTGGSVTTHYSIYQEDATITNYFAGKIGIGTTTPGALLDIGLAGTTLGTMRLEGNTSGYVQIQPAAAAGSYTLTLPTSDGDANQVLTTNGSGALSWSTPSPMVYPGAGIAVSTGSAWGTSITDSSANWNAAYSAMHTQGTDSAVNSSLSGVLFATTGTLSTKAIGTDIQAYDAELAGLSSLSYASGTPFVTMTAAGTFSLDTSTYLTASTGANTALSNLASVAINTSLVSDTDSTDDLGSSSVYWANTYTDSITMSPTSSSTVGVIFQGANSFLHNFNPPNNGAADPNGYNVFLGLDAGNFTMGSTATSASQSSYNSIFGYAGLNYNTTGYNNAGVGAVVLYRNTEGYANSAVGKSSLYENTTGTGNSVIGTGAMGNNVTGSYNSAIGNTAGSLISGGATANTTSDYSVYLGASTKALADDDQNEIVIGYNTTGLGSNTVIIGNSSITKTQLRGDVGIGIDTPTDTLHVVGNILATAGVHIGADAANNLIDDASGGTGSTTLYIGNSTINVTAPSDLSTKEKIVNTQYGLADLMKFSVKDFQYKKQFVNEGAKQKEHTGMIAQDVEDIFPEATIYRSDGLKAIDYTKMIPLIIKSIQELNTKGTIKSTGEWGSGKVDGVDSSSTVSEIKSGLTSLGMHISKGVATIEEIITQKFTAKTANIEVAKIKKMEMLDEATGETYCTWIKNGEWIKIKGECSTAESTAVVTEAVQESSATVEQPASEVKTEPEESVKEDENAKEDKKSEDKKDDKQESESIDATETQAETPSNTEAQQLPENSEPATEEAPQSAETETEAEAVSEPEPVVEETPVTEEPSVIDLVQETTSAFLSKALDVIKYGFSIIMKIIPGSLKQSMADISMAFGDFGEWMISPFSKINFSIPKVKIDSPAGLSAFVKDSLSHIFVKP